MDDTYPEPILILMEFIRTFGYQREKIKSDKIWLTASHGVRDISDKYPREVQQIIDNLAKDGIYFEVITPELEILCEGLALKTAIEDASDVPSEIFDLDMVGNWAWGNGSAQGEINGLVKSIPFGLNTLKEYLVSTTHHCHHSHIQILGEGRKQRVYIPNSRHLETVFEELRDNFSKKVRDGGLE